jgi:transposase
MGISRPTVRKHLKVDIEPVYQRQSQVAPKLSEFKVLLTKWLEVESLLPKKQRRTTMRLFEGLIDEGYVVAYDSVRRFVKHWKVENKGSTSIKQAFVPLAFKPDAVYQFDWSQEVVEIGGLEQVIKVAHFRLSCSRKMCLWWLVHRRPAGRKVRLRIKWVMSENGYSPRALSSRPLMI